MPGQKGKGKRCHEGEGEGQILSELVLPYLWMAPKQAKNQIKLLPEKLNVYFETWVEFY